MKRILLVSSLILAFCVQSRAAVVNVTYAQQVAQNFYNHKALQSSTALKLVYTATDNAANPVYYVFNAGPNQGFVIVSAESVVKPILGYSLTGTFSVNNMASATNWWMGKYQGQISGARVNATAATASISSKWDQLYNNNFPASFSRSAGSGVNPLCFTSWNQNPYYNDSCPYDQSQKALTVTGCVATAMAQIMKYWSYPPQGAGSATDYSTYGTLTVDFASVNYDWSAMPLSINSNNGPIAQLMYDCGVAVGMSYGVDGSGAQDVSLGNGPSAQSAYSQYFGYNASSIQGLYREEYLDAQWIAMMEAELDTGRLIQYGGFESGPGAEGHSWVCDGYDADTLFHMNWGWGGANDGYYSIDNLDPSGLGPDENLDGYEDAIIGIQPSNWGTTPAANLTLTNFITMNQSPYVVNTPLTITVPITNSDVAVFNGSFSAAVYDASGSLLTNLQQYSNVSISPGKDTSLTFSSNDGFFGFPGNYSIGISYQTKGIVSTFVPQGNYVNPTPLVVNSPATTLLLDSAINVTTGYIASSTPFSVTANIYNGSSLDFNGTIGAALFDMDNNFAGLIDSTSGTYLFAGKRFTYTFNNTGIAIAPGQYYLAIYSRSGANNYAWTLVNDSLYDNPVIVTVGAPLTPDIYEINNTFSQSFEFVPAFSGTSAIVATPGSNMHIGSDVDYYTIKVPPGYFTINAQVFDSQNPDGNDTYTNDVVFSYTTAHNDSMYSPVYDGVMPEPYQYSGGDITFMVTDKVPGTIGTYVLKVEITNDLAAGIAAPASTSMTVYPNPAHDVVAIDAGSLNGIFELGIYDLVGKKLLSHDVEIQQGQLINEDLSSLADGMYIVRLLSGSATREAKVIVSH